MDQWIGISEISKWMELERKRKLTKDDREYPPIILIGIIRVIFSCKLPKDISIWTFELGKC